MVSSFVIFSTAEFHFKLMQETEIQVGSLQSTKIISLGNFSFVFYKTGPVSILFVFIRVYDFTYVKTQFSHSKLHNFISSWDIIKATIKLCKKFFFHKINKNMQRKPGMKCFVHSRVWRHSRRIQNFVTS